MKSFSLYNNGYRIVFECKYVITNINICEENHFFSFNRFSDKKTTYNDNNNNTEDNFINNHSSS